MASAVAMMVADVAGEWRGSAEGPNGSMERVFTFKVDGADAMTLTAERQGGEGQVIEWKVNKVK
jgi:hypothetical protein